MEIIWSLEATNDIENLFCYIASDDRATAIRIYNKITEHIEGLTDQPHIGRSGRVTSTRELIISHTPYIVPYRVRNSRLEIIRMYHSSRKSPKRFS